MAKFNSELWRKLALIFMGLFIVQAIGFIFLSYAIFHKIDNQTKILIPFTGGGNLEISNDGHANAKYLDVLATNVIDLRFDNQPSTVEQNQKRLLANTSARAYHELKKVLDTEQQKIEKNNLSSVFYIDSQTADVVNSRVLVSGKFVTWDGHMQTSSEKKSYLIKFVYEGETMKLASIQDVTAEVEKDKLK